MATNLQPDEERLLRTAIRLNMIVTAVAFGLASGAAIWLATIALVVKGGDDPGAHLSLLSVVMAGYSVTSTGARIGFLWGFIYGALSGGILYWTYARALRRRLVRFLVAEQDTEQLQPLLLLSGTAMGIGLGLVAAMQLVAITSWLVLTGRAPYSQNLALLSHYLPGYRVSFVGSLIGAAELFVLAFLGAQLVATVYNAIARARNRS